MPAKVLVLGTYHMANPGRDLVKTQIADTLGNERQSQIGLLLGRLAAFEPTKIAIESREDGKVNERYRAYREGKIQLSANEIEQVGFRLAADCGHEELFGIDYPGNMDFDKLLKFAKSFGHPWFAEDIEKVQRTLGRKMEDIDRRFTVSQILSIYNSDNFLALSHRLYIDMLRLNAGPQYPGAEVVAEWYRRNMVIYANLRRIIKSPSDRVLVLYGAGHVKLLRDFVLESGDLEVVHPRQYLPAVPEIDFTYG